MRGGLIHLAGSLCLAATMIPPVLGGTANDTGVPFCPGNFGDPLCAIQPNCWENAMDCANQSYTAYFYCCSTHSEGCCQYVCKNWICPTGCWIQIGGIRIGMWPLACFTGGVDGTSRLRVTDHPLTNATCVDPPGVCQTRE